MSKTQPETAPGGAKEKTPPASVSLSFPRKGKIQPEGWTGVGIDQEVRIVLVGKVTRLSDDTADDWPGAGKELRLDISSCRFSVDREKPMSMDEAMEEEKKSRKRV